MSQKIDFEKLDAIRGIAAFYVCVNHSRGNFFEGVNLFLKNNPNLSIVDKAFLALTQFTILGHEAVILFFVLSGFSIAYSVSKTKNILSFYQRRIIRLYPPYLAGILWALIVYGLLKFTHPVWLDPNSEMITARQLNTVNMFDTGVFIKNLFYINNGFLLAQYWSLAHEVIFYALVPLFIMRTRLYIVVSIILFIVHTYLYNFHYSHETSMFENYFLHYNFYFAIGIAIFIYRDKLLQPIFKKFLFNIILCLILYVICIGVKMKTGNGNVLPELVSAVLCLVMMQTFLNHDKKYSILSYLGNISYSLYVTHFATLFFIKYLAAKFFGYEGGFISNYYVWMIIPFLCIPIAHLVYLLAEKPSKEYISKLRKAK